AAAQQPLTVATGPDGGTYVRFFTEITQQCSQPPLQALSAPRGSLQSYEFLTRNAANIGFMQEDVLFGKKQIENDPDADNIKTLMVLYPEEIHIITRSPNVNRFSDLGNKKIGSWGGSMVTAWVLFNEKTTGIRPIEIKDTGNAGTAVQLLREGKLDAILAVGGQPLDWVQKNLDNSFKLVPFDRLQQAMTIGYERALLKYSNLFNGGIAETITTKSLLVTYNYESASKMRDLASLRNCIIEKLPEIRETTGTHAKWRLVNPKAPSKWEFHPVVKNSVSVPAKKVPAAPARKTPKLNGD
ncbi:MAG TPA: TAXI family TRAP transporter solute-binding subunit, partial [Blastocatellia bacterium]|nr:TAXI family TRAP transporter solute-binding subunit [Blastocatellia bacterium]